MLIGELSKKTGFTRDAIRFYQKKGLLKINKKLRRGNNYIEYPDQAIPILSFIKIGKELGFTLKETKIFLSYWEGNNTDSNDLNKMVINKIKEIDIKINQLKEFKAKLKRAMKQCD